MLKFKRFLQILSCRTPQVTLESRAEGLSARTPSQQLARSSAGVRKVALSCVGEGGVSIYRISTEQVDKTFILRFHRWFLKGL